MSIANTINKLLNLDPAAQLTLNKLNGKSFGFFCTDFSVMQIYCCVIDNGIELQRYAPATTYTKISAPLSGFMQLLIHKNATNIQTANLVVEGDHESAQLFQKMIFELNIDWEEELSKYTGDIVATRAIYYLKQLRSYSTENSSALEQMVVEYLQDEARLLPAAYEMHDFLDAVDDLRLQVDRLDAKLALYKSRNKQHESC